MIYHAAIVGDGFAVALEAHAVDGDALALCQELAAQQPLAGAGIRDVAQRPSRLGMG